jgi:hypothetical protein
MCGANVFRQFCFRFDRATVTFQRDIQNEKDWRVEIAQNGSSPTIRVHRFSVAPEVEPNMPNAHQLYLNWLQQRELDEMN